MAALTTMTASLGAGEISPTLYGRVDLAKYQTALKTCRNFVVMPEGGVTKRAGTAFVGAAHDQDHPVRLIPFQYNTAQSYALEFGHFYMRVIANGGHIVEPELLITGATQANPVVITIENHGYAVGDEIYIDGVEGMEELNGRNYVVSAVADVDHFAIPVNGVGFGAFTGCTGGTTVPDPADVPGSGDSGDSGSGGAGGGGEPVVTPPGYYEEEDPPFTRPPRRPHGTLGVEP